MIVGVNKYQSESNSNNTSPSSTVEVLSIDTTHVLKQQLEKLKKLKSTRDSKLVQLALDNLTAAATSDSIKENGPMNRGSQEQAPGNLLGLAIEAAKARCTVGEITEALEKVWGRFTPTLQVISGAYISTYTTAEDITGFKGKLEVII